MLRLSPQLPIVQLLGNLTTPIEERQSMTASSCVIQRLMQRCKVSWSPNLVFEYVGTRLIGSPVYHQHTLEVILLEPANTWTPPRE